MERKYQTGAYVSGNNAVKMDIAYENQQRQVRRPKKRHKAAHKIHPIYNMILVLVIMITLGISVLLLKTQFVVTNNAEYIISLQQNLVEIEKKNAQIESDINKSVNMDEVYRVATQELGMVQAGQANIKYIESEDLAYTVQYNDVDVMEKEAESHIGNILAFITKGW